MRSALARWFAVVLSVALIASSVAHVGGAHAVDHGATKPAPNVSVAVTEVSNQATQPCENGTIHGVNEACSTVVGCSFAVPLQSANTFAGVLGPKFSFIVAEIYSGAPLELHAPPPKLIVQA